MPLPDHALTIHGGCNCGAIRYKVEIPDRDQRPLNAYHQANTPDAALRFPMIATDHCNDCRRATGSILPFWIATPLAMVSGSFILRNEAESRHKDVPKKIDERLERTPWIPASETFIRDSKYDTYLSFFESSPAHTRSFCSLCGTNLTYAVVPMPQGWPDMLDIVLGTVDREDLEKDLSPERELWHDRGITWIQNFARNGSGGIPRHPLSDINIVKE
jgi:hypothetical protein